MSLSLSENVIAVTDALRYGIATHGKPFLYYSDNSSGETNLTLDADVTGILRRLEIDHPTVIAGNPQGRGIIERLNRIARRFQLITVPALTEKPCARLARRLNPP